MTLYGRPDKTTNILGGDGVSVIESPLNPTQSVPVVALGDHLELVIRNQNKINSNGLLIVVNQKITIVGNRKIDILSNLDFLVEMAAITRSTRLALLTSGVKLSKLYCSIMLHLMVIAVS